MLDELRRVPATHICAKLEARRHKIFRILHFLQSDMVLAMVSPFSSISNAISSEKSWLISMHFLLVRTVEFFRSVES